MAISSSDWPSSSRVEPSAGAASVPCQVYSAMHRERQSASSFECARSAGRREAVRQEPDATATPVSWSSAYRIDYSRMEEDWPDAAAAPSMTTPRLDRGRRQPHRPSVGMMTSQKRGGYLPIDKGNRRQREEERAVQPTCMRCDGEIAWEPVRIACGELEPHVGPTIARPSEWSLEEPVRPASSFINPSELPPVPDCDDEAEDNATKAAQEAQGECMLNRWR